jgi:hypothetical protein
MSIRILATIFMLIMVAGCKTTDIGTILQQQPVDDNFEKVTIKWGGTYGGANSIYYIKTFRVGDQLGLCGARVSEDTAVFDDGADIWFDKARVVIGNAQNIVASARFIAGVEPPTKARPAMARCVKTSAPATDYNLRSPARVIGDAITVSY